MTGFKSKKAAALDEDGMYLVHQTDHSEDILQMVAQPVQEPVEDVVEYFADGTRIVRIAPQRPWVGLTDEEISALSKGHMTRNGFARNVIAKFKDKNK